MKNKKIIAIMVAIILVLSVFAIATMANTKNTSLTISINKSELSAGQSATVTVSASADYPVATASIPVFYDKTMVTVSNATANLTGYDVTSVTTDANAIDSAKIYANTNIDSNKFGFILVTYIGGAGDTVSTIENKTLLTFTVTAKSGVSGDALVKCVTESAKTDDNVAGMLYFGTTTNGTTINSIPENVENINVLNASKSVTITTNTSNTDIVAKEDMPTVIDPTNKYVYGITAGGNIEDYIEVNNGSFELVANSLGKTNGTGATVKVKNASGTVVDTYTVIVFGDVNGDAAITMMDAGVVNLASLGAEIEGNTAYTYAADINGDAAITMIDAGVVNLATLGAEITTNPYAK
ncbi:MAG: hypothetical protein IKW45_00475 [Clostridia bacterium]|nr:hypothetical protein [Clostridia bacterium]